MNLAPSRPRSREVCSSSPVLFSRIGRRLVPFGHAVVAHHGGDAQAIIAEHALAAGLLGLAVVLDVAPGLHRRLVAPEGERQDLAVVGQALEALDGNEAVDLLEL